MMVVFDSDVFGFIKPSLDAHTLGMNSVAELLHDCGYNIIIGDKVISEAANNFRYAENIKLVLKWICFNKVNRIGFSYRLDPAEAINMVGYFMNELQHSGMLSYQGGPIKAVYFGGLPEACNIIEKEHKGYVIAFKGGESVRESLVKIGIPDERIPKDIKEGSLYDDQLMEFGKSIIESQEYDTFMPIDRSGYKEYGTKKDTVIKRITSNMQQPFFPLIRAHVGPYISTSDRWESINEFLSWVKYLADTKYLDILSIGSSQLTQSNFGEDWGDKPNGGGVPINSPEEYSLIWQAARPLLIRTYAGTKNILQLAEIYEKTINICWHALSLWWFNKLDGRGPYDLYTNLKQHVETIKYVVKMNKPFEANVSHHFAFRGADDVTYVVSAYLSAKLAKKIGVRTFILQNMLNTPRYTWGVQDLAKSRAMLMLVKQLEDSNFKVILQPRAGLDYFRFDLEEAKMQLSAVTALMDDIIPNDETSPSIIHVVSYSEASRLATPEIINESIKITQYSLQEYRKLRKNGNIEDMNRNKEVQQRMEEIVESAKEIIRGIEKYIMDPYSAEGFYKIFASGFLPVPYLWAEVEEFRYAKRWKSRIIKGSSQLVGDDNKPIKSDKVVDFAKRNIKEVEYYLNGKNCKSS